MSGQQSYIVRLLRRVEAELVENRQQVAGEMLDKMIQKVSRADDISQALELLYSVRGFDQFALRLMWSLERHGIQFGGMDESVLEYEVESLGACMQQCVNGREPAVDGRQQELSVEEALDGFYEALHRFGRAIEDLKRPSLHSEKSSDSPVERLYRILNETAGLQEAAESVGKEDVVRFTGAYAGFVQYVLDHDTAGDVRVVNVLDNANLTLQTVQDAAAGEDIDSLQQIIELLRRPQELLD